MIARVPGFEHAQTLDYARASGHRLWVMTDVPEIPEPFRRPIPTLTRGRLVLRPFAPADAASLESVINDREIADGTMSIPHPYPKGAGLPWIEQHAERWGAGRSGTWAITEPDGDLLGAISLWFTLVHRRAEVGYWVARKAWGRGVATEAVRAVIAFAFDELDLHRVDAHHFVENPASGRVMEKAGMRSEGRRRGAVIRAGVPRDVEEYAILAIDPRP